MASRAYYTPAETAELTGASKPALRIYTNTYARWFSTEATPGAGATRKFTSADLKVIAFIRQQTTLGQTHEQVQEQLGASALDSFDWATPEEDNANDSEQTALTVPMERLQAAQALLTDSRQREEQAQAQIQALQEQARQEREKLQEQARQDQEELHQRIEDLQKALGRAEGELGAVRRRRPAWWSRIFGE